MTRETGPAGVPRRPPARAVVIINPMSGRGRVASEVQDHGALARQVLGSHGIDATIRPTGGAGDAAKFAREAAADRTDLVVVWGGDGTLNEAASGLVHSGIPLGIVAAGSGNGLAWDLNLPFDPVAALTVAARGVEFPIDAGEIHDSLFFNIAGIGVDAVISARFAERGRGRRGPLGYLQIGMHELMQYRAQVYRFTIENQESEQRALLIALANGRQYGNRVCIAPGACLDDGRLELVVVDQLSVLSIAWRLPSLFRGTLRAGGPVSMRAVSAMRVCAEREIPYHVDGEPRLGPREIDVRTHHRALIVKVPESRQPR